MQLTTGTLVAIEDDAVRTGVLSVGGARARVALELLPAAKVGDVVLAHAGLALAVIQPDGAPAE